MSTIASITETDFSQRFATVLDDVLGVNGYAYAGPIYKLIYSANFAADRARTGRTLFGEVQTQLWMWFSGGGATTIATEQLFRALGLDSEIPVGWHERL